MKRTLTSVGLILVLAVLFGALTAEAKNKTIEKYQANAIMQTRGAGSTVEINIYRWSSDAERDEILDTIKMVTSDHREGDREVAKALRGQKKAGYAWMSGRQGYPLRFAREHQTADGKRVIQLATDRPVSFQEAYQDSMLGDFDVTVIILTVDEKGKGEGILSIGTELKWDEATQKLDPTNVSTQAMRLTNVRRVDK